MNPLLAGCLGFVGGCWFQQGLRWIDRKIGDVEILPVVPDDGGA